MSTRAALVSALIGHLSVAQHCTAMAMSKVTQTNGHEIYGSRPTVYSGMELEWQFTLAALQGTTPFPDMVDGIN